MTASSTLTQRFPVLRSFWAVARDPNRTGHGARVVLSLDRKTIEACFQRFAATREGARILGGEPSLMELLTDRAWLASLPDASLGRAYLAFMEREGISTEALDAEVAPIEAEILRPDAVRRRFHQHHRASHDLWHVLTGYHRDLLGELLVLAFSAEQTGSRSFHWITKIARVGRPGRLPGARAWIDDATRRGQEAEWLLTAPWRELLPQSIDDVRTQLGIGPPPIYTRYVRGERAFSLVPEKTTA